MENSNIGWCHHTQNFWLGCDKIAPECAHCYIERTLRRQGRVAWGRIYQTKTWRDPLRWQAEASRQNFCYRVFTNSLSDFFHAQSDAFRDAAWDVIRQTPNLVWLILTKRPERVLRHLPRDWGTGWPNVWLGVSCGCRQTLTKMDSLRKVPIHPLAVRFLSAEPYRPLDPALQSLEMFGTRIDSALGRDVEWENQSAQVRSRANELRKSGSRFHESLQNALSTLAKQCSRALDQAHAARSIKELRDEFAHAEDRLARMTAEVQRALDAEEGVAYLDHVLALVNGLGEQLSVGLDEERRDVHAMIRRARQDHAVGAYPRSHALAVAARQRAEILSGIVEHGAEDISRSVQAWIEQEFSYVREDGSQVRHRVEMSKLHPKLSAKFEISLRKIRDESLSSPGPTLILEFEDLRRRMRTFLLETAVRTGKENQRLIARKSDQAKFLLHWQRKLDWQELVAFARAVKSV